MEAEAFESLMTALVRDDDSRLSPGDVSAALGLVINRYNADRPLTLVEDCLVDADLVLQTPEHWVNKRSSLRAIEWPIGSNPPKYITEDAFYVYDLPAGDVELRLLAGTATADQLVRVSYTTVHTTPDTFHADDCEALVCLGAAILCDQLAALYGHASDVAIQADSVNHNDKGRQFAARAREYRARYEGKFGKPTTSSAASAIVRPANPRPQPGMFRR
ncbi:MAG: hypothetical protein Q8K17_00255 [Pseudohongiella sp.]|nr:hypothetical protein [Pseudohongiella sp.]MDP2091406.1 hypothetical protein [Pseudohongiella sp.]